MPGSTTPLEVGEASRRLRRSSRITDAIAASLPVAVGALAVAVGILGFAYLRSSDRADRVVVALESLETQSAELQETNDRLARLAEQFAILVDRESTTEERDAARAEVTRLREEIEAARAAQPGTTSTTTQPRARSSSSTSSTTTAPPASASPAAPPPSTSTTSTTTSPPPTTTTTRPVGCALGTLPIVCPP